MKASLGTTKRSGYVLAGGIIAVLVFVCLSTKTVVAQTEIPLEFGENRLDEAGGCGGEGDTFIFDTELDDRLFIRVIQCESFGISCGISGRQSFDPCVELRNEAGDRLARDCGENSAFLGSERIRDIGMHSIFIRDSGRGAGRYNVFIQRLNNPGQIEEELFSGDNLLGRLDCGQVHTYTFMATPGTLASIDMIPDAVGEIDPRVELYDDRGRAVAIPDSGTIEETLERLGRFTLLAFSRGNATGTYRISLTLSR